MTDFVRVEWHRLSWRECWRATRGWTFILLAFVKILRLHVGPSWHGHHPRSLSPFEVDAGDLSDVVRARLAARVEELACLGFVDAWYYRCGQTFCSEEEAGVVMRHHLGKALVRVLLTDSEASPSGLVVGGQFLSKSAVDGSLYATLTCPDGEETSEPWIIKAPHEWGRCVEASTTAQWWAEHEEMLVWLDEPISPIATRRDMIQTVEESFRRFSEFHESRGVLVRLTDKEAEAAAAEWNATQARIEQLCDDDELVARVKAHAGVLAEMDRSERGHAAANSFALVLVVSAVLFVAAGASWWSWSLTLVLVPVVFLHELGHCVAMRILGFRNLKIMFVPLLGAAAVGENNDASGWKEAVISLAGPIPSIVIAAAVAWLGVAHEIGVLMHVATLMLALNVLNLLPILPLDGGHLLRATFCCQDPFVEVLFQVVCAALLLGAVLLGAWELAVLGCALLAGVPSTMREIRMARRVAKRGVQVGVDGNGSRPLGATLAVIDEVQRSSKKMLSDRDLAAAALAVIGRLSARPPGALATAGLLAVYLGGFITFGVVMVYTPALRDFSPGARPLTTGPAPGLVYACEQTCAPPGDRSDPGSEAGRTIAIADYADGPSAEATSRRVRAELCDQSGMLLFGQSVLIRSPLADRATKEAWWAELRLGADSLCVADDDAHVRLTLTCRAPDWSTARGIADELDVYWSLYLSRFLSPPWSSLAPPEKPARGPRYLARRTCLRLEEELFASDFVVAAVKAGPQAADVGGRQSMIHWRHQRACEEIRQQGDPFDEEVVSLFGDSAYDLPFGRVRYQQMLALRLGACPSIEYESAEPHGDVRAAPRGWVHVRGRELAMEGVTFADVFEDIEQLGSWLCRLGCEEIRYYLECVD